MLCLKTRTSQVLEEQSLSIPSVCLSLPPTMCVYQALRCKSLWGICVGDGRSVC